MDHVELRDILVDRVGFKQPTDVSFTLDAVTTKSDSGRYFEDEHPVVTVRNILATTQEIATDDAGANTLLQSLVKRACIQVVGDVFEVSDIPDDILTNRTNIFDDCISKRMAINVGELIINSTRSNLTETITKEIQQRIFFEVNGNEGNNNFPTYVGLKSRYGACIKKLKDSLEQEKGLDVFTYRLPNYDNPDEFLIL